MLSDYKSAVPSYRLGRGYPAFWLDAGYSHRVVYYLVCRQCCSYTHSQVIRLRQRSFWVEISCACDFVKIIRNRNRLQKSEIASEIQKSLVEIRNRGLKSEITVWNLKSRFEIRNHGWNLEIAVWNQKSRLKSEIAVWNLKSRLKSWNHVLKSEITLGIEISYAKLASVGPLAYTCAVSWQPFLEVSMHPRAVLQFKSTVRVPRQPTMSVFPQRGPRRPSRWASRNSRTKAFSQIHESNCKLWSCLVCLALVDA